MCIRDSLRPGQLFSFSGKGTAGSSPLLFHRRSACGDHYHCRLPAPPVSAPARQGIHPDYPGILQKQVISFPVTTCEIDKIMVGLFRLRENTIDIRVCKKDMEEEHMGLILPAGYDPRLSVRETQEAVSYTHLDVYKRQASSQFQRYRSASHLPSPVSAPGLFGG